jgi:putative oxidoreductase
MPQATENIGRGKPSPPPAVFHNPLSHAMHTDTTAAGLQLALVESQHKAEKRRRQWHREELHVIGRLLMGTVFLVAAIAKMSAFSTTADALADAGLTATSLLLGVGIALELVGGLSLLAGWGSRYAAVGLMAYLAAVTILVNNNFALEMNREAAMMNLGLCAGLFMLISRGSGLLSLDSWLQHRRMRRYAA